MNRVRLGQLLCGCISLGFFTTATWATSGTPTWSLSLVSTVQQGFWATSPRLAFDHYGTPSVSWSSVQGSLSVNTVRHSHLTGLGFWSHRDVATGIGVGMRTAISFDRSERPTVAWINDNGAVQGQFNFGSAQTIAASGANVNLPTMSLYHDLAGSLRGMFAGTTAGAFSSIGYSSGNFSSGAMVNFSGAPTILDATMVVDHRGLRHLAARANVAGGQQGVLLASEPIGGGTWSTSTFLTADSVDGLDLAVDPDDGKLAIAYSIYTSATNTSKMYYRKFNDGSTGLPPIIDTTSARIYDVSLAFDRSDGRPAIAYERQANAPYVEELWYGYLDASLIWQSSLVDGTVSIFSPDGKARAPSLAFDDYGTSWPAIAYVDQNGSVMTAFDPPAPEPTTAGALLFAVLLRRSSRRRGVCRRGS